MDGVGGSSPNQDMLRGWLPSRPEKPLSPTPGVGQNLQDHLEVYIQQACTRPITLHSAQRPLRKIRIGLEWLWKFTGGRAGPGT